MSETVRLWFVRESDQARCYSKLPPERRPDATDLFWLPKSQIENTVKFPTGMHEVKIPSWLAERHGL
jgi:hypothetical protein